MKISRLRSYKIAGEHFATHNYTNTKVQQKCSFMQWNPRVKRDVRKHDTFLSADFFFSVKENARIKLSVEVTYYVTQDCAK